MLEPKIVTFYSFRGGVGRSMAMLNVGYLLAQSGRRVLLVDFDLEAPGLTRLIDRLEISKAKPKKAKPKGLVDILHDYLFSPATSILNPKSPHKTLSPFMAELDVPPNNNHYGKCGSLHLMPAGHTGHYEKKLDQLNMSSREFKKVRKAFATRFRNFLLDSERFDYIFIDARTGFSDEGYISAKFLCDHLIVLSGLNDQNIKGTAEFLTKIAAWKKDGYGPKRFFLVASPVCEYEDDKKIERYREVRKILKNVTGADIGFTLSLPYHPRLALYEELVALRWPESGLGRAYSELAHLIRYINEDDKNHWAKHAQDATEQLNADAFTEAIENFAAIDRQQAVNFARQTSVSLARLSGDEAKKALLIIEASAKIDPDEPLFPLQAARSVKNAKLPTKEVLKYLDHAAKLAQDNTLAMADILYERADTLVKSNSAAACDNALEAFKIYERFKEEDTAINALLLAARAEQSRYDYSAAVSHAKHALLIARKATLQDRITLCLKQLVSLYCDQNKYDIARETCEKYLEIARKSGNRLEEWYALYAIGSLECYQGNISKVRRKQYEKSLKIAQELGYDVYVTLLLHSLANLDIYEGSFASAQKRLAKALMMSRKIGDNSTILYNTHRFADTERLLGNYTAARKLYEKGLMLSHELHSSRDIAGCLHGIATIDRLQGQFPAARKALEKSLKIRREHGIPSQIASNLHGLGEIDRCSGDYSAALNAFGEAMSFYKPKGFVTELNLLRVREEATRIQLDGDRTLVRLRSLVRRAMKDTQIHVSLFSLLLLGEFERERRFFKKALATIDKALEKAQNHGMKDIVAFSQAERALCLSSLGQNRDASIAAKAALTFFKNQNVRYSNAAKLRKIAEIRPKSKKQKKKSKP